MLALSTKTSVPTSGIRFLGSTPKRCRSSAPGRTWLAAAAMGGFCLLACKSPTPDSSTEADQPTSPPEPLTLRAGQEGVLFTYRDPDTGRFETAETIEAIPEAARGSVVVTDLGLSPEARGSGRYVHVADVRAPGPDGRYPVAVASRYGFERAGTLDTTGEPAAPTSPVILYSASWCGVCRKAKRVLGEWGVPFEEKDIEASRSALEELEAKAARAGMSPGGVPVIDVQGTLLQGLDIPRLQSLLRQQGLLEG